MQAAEYSTKDLWTNVTHLVIARNEYRFWRVPHSARERPGDRLYAAQFFHAPEPEAATWNDIREAAFQRDEYLKRLGWLLVHPEGLN